MPKDPNEQKRPADMIGAAFMVGRITKGEDEDTRAETIDARQPAPTKRGPYKKRIAA